jgi:hypothetical protein
MTLLLSLKIEFISLTSQLNVLALHFLRIEKNLIFLVLKIFVQEESDFEFFEKIKSPKVSPKIPLIMVSKNNITIVTKLVNIF